MARIVGVLGPVTRSRLPRDDHRAPTSWRASTSTRTSSRRPTGGGRKDFLIALVKVVMQQRARRAGVEVGSARARRWAQGFDAREAMAWSSEPVIQNALVERVGRHAPASAGRLLLRGRVRVRREERWRSAPHVRPQRRAARRRLGADHDEGDDRQHVAAELRLRPHAQHRLAELHHALRAERRARSARRPIRPTRSRRAIAGHPAAGWFESADPLSSTSFTVVWNVPHLLTPASDGASRLPARTSCDSPRTTVTFCTYMSHFRPVGAGQNGAPPATSCA